MLDEIIMQMKSHGRIETYGMISMLINSLRWWVAMNFIDLNEFYCFEIIHPFPPSYNFLISYFKVNFLILYV
jgi:hypothetical protein